MALPVGALVPNGEQQFFDLSGNPLANGFVYMYVPYTSTPSTTWVDPYLTTANTNPIRLDGGGKAIIWGNTVYRQVVTDQFGNLIWDQITSIGLSSSTSISVPSVAALRALNITTNGATVWLLGYDTAGDKQPVMYVFSSTSTATDNGGTIIQPTVVPAGQAGRWIAALPDNGLVNLVDFGPVGQGNDDAPAMAAALATGYNVQLPNLILNFNSQQASGTDVFQINANDQKIIGAGVIGKETQTPLSGTIIQCPLSGVTIFHFITSQACGIQNVAFYCPSMTDGWMIFFDGCGPWAYTGYLEFMNCPGAIAFGGLGGNTSKALITEHVRCANMNGGSVSILDGTSRSTKACFYAWNFTTTQNNGPWFGLDWVCQAGANNAASVFLLLDGFVNSNMFRTLRFNTPDVGIALINSQSIGTNPNLFPQFNWFDDVAVQTPASTIYPYGVYLNSGNQIVINKIFVQDCAQAGLLFGQNASNLLIEYVTISNCQNDCLHLAGNQAYITGGRVQNANEGNNGSACVTVASAANNISINNILEWGAANGGDDISIASNAQFVWLIGNNWSGSPQNPTAINDPGFVGWYSPAIRSTFTPTVSFQTAGDQSWSYARQSGYFWQDGDFFKFLISLSATVTYSSAQGVLYFDGLPVAAGGNSNDAPVAIAKISNYSLDSGYTGVSAYLASSQVQLWEYGSGKATQQLGVTNVTSGTSIVLIASGEYQSS